MSKTYYLHTRQRVKVPSEILWEFLSHPRNLQRLTPPELEFEILGDVPEVVEAGTVIDYRIRIPVFGRRRWRTEILEVEPGHRFVDIQAQGPYKSWHHEHLIQELADGSTEMVDNVAYQMPFGWLGRIAHAVLVRRQLRKIFSYRRMALDDWAGAASSR